MALFDNNALLRHPYLIRMPRDDREWTKFIQALNVQVIDPENITEEAQDAVGSILLDSASINFTYDDSFPTITAEVIPQGVDHNQLSNLPIGDFHPQYELEANLAEDAQDAVGLILVDSSEINFTYSDATPSITASLIDTSIVYARLQNAEAVSVLGRSANSSGVLDEIAAGANDRLLRRTSDTVNFGQLTAGMFPNTVVPDAALSSNVPLLNAVNIFTGATQTITATRPELRWNESDAATDEKVWGLGTSGGDLILVTRDDSNVFGAQPIVLTRTGTVVDSIALTATAITLNGTSVFNAGLFTAGSLNDARLSANVPLKDAANVFTTTQKIAAGAAIQRFRETGAATDEKEWFYAALNSGRFRMGATDDAVSSAGSDFISVDRTGETIDEIWFGNATDGPDFLFLGSGTAIHAGRVRLFGYTVAGLPAGTVGDTAYVTDALAPVFGAAVAAGGAVMVPVYYTGAAWFVG